MAKISRRHGSSRSRTDFLRTRWSTVVAAKLPPSFERTPLEARVSRRPDGVFDHLARIDPTSHKRYLQRLCQWFEQDAFRIEDGRRVRDVLRRFDTGKAKLAVAQRDINRYRTPGDVDEVMDVLDRLHLREPLEMADVPSHVRAGSTVVASGHGWFVVRLDTDEAATWFADSTSWCTRHPSTFARYRASGDLYVLVHGRRKLQYQPLSEQLMDERDRSPSASTLDAFPRAATEALARIGAQDVVSSNPDNPKLTRIATLILRKPVDGPLEGVMLGDPPDIDFVAWADPPTRAAERVYLHYRTGRGLRRVDPRELTVEPCSGALALAFADKGPPADVLLDLGPACPAYGVTLSKPERILTALRIYTWHEGSHRQGKEVVDDLDERGLITTVLAARPVDGFRLLVRSAETYRDELVELYVRGFRHADVMSAFVETLVDDPWPFVDALDERLRRWPPGLRGLLHELCDDEEVRISVALGFVRKIDKQQAAGTDHLVDKFRHCDAHDPVRRLLAYLVTDTGVVDAIARQVIRANGAMPPSLLTMPGTDHDEWRTLADTLGRRLKAEGLPELSGEDGVALVARLSLAGRKGLSMPTSDTAREILVANVHPDFRRAYQGVGFEQGSGHIWRKPSSTATQEDLRSLLTVPDTGHLVVAVEPGLRGTLVEEGLSRGRGGVAAAFDAEHATVDLYQQAFATGEADFIVERASTTSSAIRAAVDAGANQRFVDMLEAAWFVNGGGPKDLATAFLEFENSGLDHDLSQPVTLDFVRWEPILHAIRHGRVRPDTVREEAAAACTRDPGLLDLRPDLLQALKGTDRDYMLMTGAASLAHFAPEDIGMGTLPWLAKTIRGPGMALGTCTSGPSGIEAWHMVAKRVLDHPDPSGKLARTVLEHVPFDPGSTANRKMVAALMARAGATRPVDEDGRPWPWTMTAKVLVDALGLPDGSLRTLFGKR